MRSLEVFADSEAVSQVIILISLISRFFSVADIFVIWAKINLYAISTIVSKNFCLTSYS